MGLVMRRGAMGLAAVLAIGAGGIVALRIVDGRSDATLRDELRVASSAVPALPFDPAVVHGLPEPARRFFHFAIKSGTPLRTAAVINMAGELSLGTRDDWKSKRCGRCGSLPGRSQPITDRRQTLTLEPMCGKMSYRI